VRASSDIIEELRKNLENSIDRKINKSIGLINVNSRLKLYYGENWRHPVIAFNYNLSSIGRVKEYTIQYIKALLPERLLEILQEKKDKKRMCQWIKKAHQFKL